MRARKSGPSNERDPMKTARDPDEPAHGARSRRSKALHHGSRRGAERRGSLRGATAVAVTMAVVRARERRISGRAPAFHRATRVAGEGVRSPVGPVRKEQITGLLLYQAELQRIASLAGFEPAASRVCARFGRAGRPPGKRSLSRPACRTSSWNPRRACTTRKRTTKVLHGNRTHGARGRIRTCIVFRPRV